MRFLCLLAVVVAPLGCGNGPAGPAKGPSSELAFAPRFDRMRLAVGPPGDTELGAASLAPPSLELRSSTPSVGYLEGATRLSHVFEALRALEDGQSHDDVRIVQYGDSHTASDLGAAVFRRLLQARFGDGGRGFVSMGKPWKTYVQDGIRGGMTKEFAPKKIHAEDGRFSGDGCYGLLGVAIDADRPGARAWTQVAPPTSRVELDYWQQPRGGSFDVFIDGTHAGRVATRAPRSDSGFFAFEVPDAPHEVELRTVGDGSVRVFGMALDRAQAGVLVDALGINGAQVFTPLHWSEEHFTQQLRRRAPDLVVLAYGTNEALDSKLDMTEYERALVDLLGRVARAVPSASCLLLGPPDLALASKTEPDDWTTSARVLDIVAVQQRVASAGGCAFYDQLQAMGGPGSMAAWALEAEPRAARDRVHLKRSGYAQLATSLTTDLLRAYDAWRAEPRVPKTWDVAAR